MAIEILKRTFIYEAASGAITLEDPDPQMGIEEVREFYSLTYPELRQSEIDELQKDGCIEIRFQRKVGTKGIGVAVLADGRKLRSVAFCSDEMEESELMEAVGMILRNLHLHAATDMPAAPSAMLGMI